ncbi:Tyrosine protein-kinase src-2 [Holothuria leucospilota]|uniref:Tyrosine protein-kinase src-2 n=1 Tax=Holothuria leucospilota TaxID=206669 RepID=A0A9Q1BG86_HOLLE|nr:Tyrosine protein-kinase src-2 [Holothuria leucospilota]
MLDLGDHPNLVAIKGCRTIDEPFMMITEFLKFGDLLNFLRKCCDPANWTLDEQYHLRPINQVQIARQVAFGMEYVTTKKYFHGDLAARNILIGNCLCVKITDFGLTDDLYQTGITNLRSGERRPYKWYDPEAIEHQYCTVKTDIWSFGVLLWEIYTFGRATPYHGMTIQEVLRRLKDGYRLPCPSKCPSVM